MNRFFRTAVLILSLVFFATYSFASSSSIKSLSKVRSSKGYIFKINYETDKEWTDGLVFRLYCTFSKDVELTFTSSGLSNIKRGWHKTEIRVPKVYRERYGYIKDYRVEMYHNGMLISLKSL